MAQRLESDDLSSQCCCWKLVSVLALRIYGYFRRKFEQALRIVRVLQGTILLAISLSLMFCMS